MATIAAALPDQAETVSPTTSTSRLATPLPPKPSLTAPPPDFGSCDYRILHLPAMLAVYTARHQQMPASNEALHRHIFGSASQSACAACREETDFLVAHQKQFLQATRRSRAAYSHHRP